MIKSTYFRLFVTSFFLCLVIVSCKKDADNEVITTDVTVDEDDSTDDTVNDTTDNTNDENSNLTYVEMVVPSGFPNIEIPSDNPLSEEGILLGRMLYYDNLLDKDTARTCASCHTHAGYYTSYESNSMTHFNLAWNTTFLWNGLIEGTLEDGMLMEVEDFFETNMDNLNNDPTYKLMFKQVFGVDVITSKEAAYALAQYLRTVVSVDSKYDRYKRQEENLTASEFAGMELFFSEKGDCFHCHGNILLTDHDFHNNGIDSVFEKLGHGEVSRDPNDNGKFKTPTLRNVEFTAPYMHDGRFETLEEVINHYSEGLQVSSTIDPLMKNVHEGGVNLTEQEKADLLSFLKTFSDTSFANNPAYASPF